MDNLKEKLEKLKKKKIELQFIYKASFSSVGDYEKLKKENEQEFNELKKINKEIEGIEWELMTPKEQQDLIDYKNEIKEKYSE